MALLASLIAFWKLGEADGATRVDSAGSNDLADGNTVTQVAGQVGNAAQFTNANSEDLSIADNTDLSTGDIDFSIVLWVYLDNKDTTQIMLSKWEPTGNQQAYAIQYQTTADRFRFLVSNDGAATVVEAADVLGIPAIATWYFIVVWHDASANTINIQVNNGNVDSQAHTTGVFDGTAPFNIGSLRGSSQFFDGRVDAVGFWKKVLTAAEKTELYNNGAGLEHPFIADGLPYSSSLNLRKKPARRLSHSRVFYQPDFLGPPAFFRVESRTATSVHLTWDNSAAPSTSFIEIERALGDGSFSFVARIAFSQNEFTDTGLSSGTRYRYRARTV